MLTQVVWPRTVPILLPSALLRAYVTSPRSRTYRKLFFLHRVSFIARSLTITFAVHRCIMLQFFLDFRPKGSKSSRWGLRAREWNSREVYRVFFFFSPLPFFIFYFIIFIYFFRKRTRRWKLFLDKSTQVGGPRIHLLRNSDRKGSKDTARSKEIHLKGRKFFRIGIFFFHRKRTRWKREKKITPP